MPKTNEDTPPPPQSSLHLEVEVKMRKAREKFRLSVEDSESTLNERQGVWFIIETAKHGVGVCQHPTCGRTFEMGRYRIALKPSILTGRLCAGMTIYDLRSTFCKLSVYQITFTSAVSKTWWT